MPFSEKGKSRLCMKAYTQPKGCIVWHSPIDQNNKPNDFIIKGMINRFSKQEAAKRVAVYQFYENGVLVYQEKRR